ncbi:MAG: bifunctional serine/threonine-protein kinase/formylglycine-generating enzyme family protein [Myxococcota bacterium]|nr:bifunctional serine/threonine-protein kinase/formylglycine-generating enzyme family protein [Myxococcota bacterium]
MLDSQQVLHRVRTRVRLPPATMAAVESELIAGKRNAQDILQQAGLTKQQVDALLSIEGDADGEMFEVSQSVTEITEEPSVDELINRLVDITPRFELQGEIARGAMGRILAAWDLHLGRPVAIKVLRKATSRDLERVRFLEEAQVTGQLQHPGIMPVYELGRLRDQLAFVMRRIEGRSLKKVISGLRRGNEQIRKQFGRMRLLNIFHQLCLSVAYAHTRSVVHRDLKPSNVMVGDFGEVVLLDWGLCKVIGSETRSTRSTSERWQTVHGQIIGTPAYMAPEQAGGLIDEVGPRTDVYGLGAILYHLLTLRPPFVGKSNREIVTRVLQEEVVPPSERAPSRQISHELNAICMRAMAREKRDRYANATALANAIQDFIDAPSTVRGTPGSKGVEPLVQRGVAALARHQSLLEDKALLIDDIQTRRAYLDPLDPPEERAQLWMAEQRLKEVQTNISDAYAQAVYALTSASASSDEATDAQNMLCELFISRFDAAHIAGNYVEASYYRRMIAEVDDGRYGSLVANEGSMYIDVQPREAQIRIAELTVEGRRLVPASYIDHGPAPVRVDPLAAGIYSVELSADGYETLYNTVVVEPGRCARQKMRLLTIGTLVEGFVHVPAGTFRSGCRTDHYRPPSEQALPDFMIGRYPVTAAEYLDFINDVALTDPALAHARVPRTHDGIDTPWIQTQDGYDLPDELGWTPDMPIVGITVDDCVAYCQWRSSLDGQPYRLATELEWEKAARGSEGRRFPWGDDWDPSFAVYQGTWDHAWPPPVGYLDTDVSPCGASDMAGGVREWTATSAPGRRRRFVVRGGSFMCSHSDGRPLWERDYVLAESSAADLGFRLVLDCAL